jgi:hypothetical protein
MQIVLASVGVIVVIVGGLMLTRSRDASDVLREVNPVAKGLYSPAATGCAGLLLIVFGVAFVVVAIVWGVTSS